MKPHISLNVRAVPASVGFYQRLFGTAPQKQTADYAKFDLIAPALNFSLVSSAGGISSVNHLGIEVETPDELAAWKARLEDQGLITRVEDNNICCFARQDKLWVADPDGNAWEVFLVREQLPVTGLLRNTGCCVPARRGAVDAACCVTS
jgi:catechol 2,3-dioxygenase-like lactoylglutathione lyase family enzyme